jgi:site-specific DNA-methyltransferase (adenine-specific)
MNNCDLQNVDCLQLLRNLGDESVDIIIADPPYFEIINQEWDKQWKSEEEYIDWCWSWTKECERVLKPGAPMYVWGTTKTDTFLKYKLDVLNAMQQLQYSNWIIWSYDWGGRTKKTWPRKHEDLLMYYKRKCNVGKQHELKWHPESITVPRALKKNIRTGADFTIGKVPTDVWNMNNHTGSKEYVSWHPTQKPLELLKRCILAHTEENDIVLDPFAGSGSTAIAALLCKRKFIGAEISAHYHKNSIIRINEYILSESTTR